MAKAPFRLRLAKAILGNKAKDFIPALNPNGDGVLWPGSGGDGIRTYTNKVDQLSANLGWSFAANKAIVDQAAAVELKAYRKSKQTGEREEADDDRALELLDLLSNPNNVHTGEQWNQLHHTYMNFNGESYTMMFRNGQPWEPQPGLLPQALQEIPAHLVQFKLSKQGYSKSTVRYQGEEYPLGIFVRDLNPDPSNPFYGISIISAAASIINADNQMRDWNNNLMANGANPSVVFTSNEQLDDMSYDRWKQQFQDEHTGALNSGKPLLIEGGDVKPFMLSPRDLDFLESRKFTRDEILAMWRVSPYIIGSVEDVNLATAKAARILHAEVNIEPRVRQWVRQLNNTIVKVFDPHLELGYENIVPSDEDAMLKYHQAAVNKWETIDEARAAYGDDAIDDDLGAQLYLLNNNAPLASIADGSAKPQPVAIPGAPAPEADGTDDPSKDGKKSLTPRGVKKKDLTSEQLAADRLAQGNAKVARYRQAADQFETHMAQACAAQFNHQRDQILAHLDLSRIDKSYTRKDWLQDLIDWAGATTDFKNAIQPVVQAVLIQAGQDAMQGVGKQASTFDPFSPALVDYFQSRSLKIALDVNDETSKQIRAALSQGVRDGKSSYELRAEVERIMGSASTMRADRIARTEVTRAQGYADIQAWSQSGVVTGKEWFTAEDEHVCPFCDDLDHKTWDLSDNIFDKGESLTVDGQTQQYNYDDVPSPPLHVNCRCVLLPVRG